MAAKRVLYVVRLVADGNVVGTSSRSLSVIVIASTSSDGSSGGNTPRVREYALDHASGRSRRRAASLLPATATVAASTTYGLAARVDGLNRSRYRPIHPSSSDTQNR
jgi:hypothetical protein